jgi:quinohemoprotein ethanol dehydrogenase
MGGYVSSLKNVAFAVAIVLTGIGGQAERAWAADGSKAGNVDGARIEAADKDPGSWLAHGRTYSEQRFSPLDKINEQNVGELGLAWWYEIGTERGIETTPLVIDGVMYGTGSWSIVFALDPRTGKELWRYDPEVPKEYGRNACCDVVNRGVAVWEGMVYVGTIDGRLIALNAANGEKVWEANTTGSKRPYTITGAPRVVKGKVIIGNGGAELGARGYFTAYDAKTGKQVWRFYTVPGDPSKPVENPELTAALKTWKGGEWWKVGGGGTVWDSMAYDPELNLLYVGTGNGSPWSKHLRSPGGGDNLYLSSILAIDPDTGRMKWYFQTTPGDTWDYTATQHMILADLTIDGKPRKVIMQAPKNGFFYVLDRETGKFISGEKYSTVTWAKGLDADGRPIFNPEAFWKDKTAIVIPGPLGGHNWQPMSFDPRTGLVYIPQIDIPAAYIPKKDFKYRPGGWNTGMDWTNADDADPKAMKGSLLAWNPVTQSKAWQVPLWGAWNGGVLSTAGNLVFQGTGNGFFNAYRASDGKQLWQAPIGTGVLASPVTYVIDGEQYVTVGAGWGGAFALVYGRMAKSAGVHAAGRIMTFKVGGHAAPPPMENVKMERPTPPPLTASAEEVERGRVLYQNNCQFCHGAGVVGGGVIPDLRYSEPGIHEMYHDIVLKGALAHGGMAQFDDLLTASDVDAIHAYVIKRAHEPGDAPPEAHPEKPESNAPPAK